MSQALYRKYRPQTFDEVFGQENVIAILKNQIINHKMSHAYLFSGTRGTGKTSVAKIFSRAANCLAPVEGNPCNMCANCRAILDETTLDVVEMDAASNRRIDDIRALRDTVIYAPADLKYKVYIIDEAHMITNEGFNALLKIMEEPPRHLIFILATTEIDKIPDTIISRTQRFDFKKIDDDNISARIKEVLEREDVAMDEAAIASIANIGKGSMRDALSILDQVISMKADHFTIDSINDILGMVSDKTKASLLEAILQENLIDIRNVIDQELEKGKDAHHFIKEIIAYFEDILDSKLQGQAKDSAMQALVEAFSVDRLIDSLDILMDYESKIKRSDNRNLLLKMAMMRLVDHSPRDVLERRIRLLEEKLSALLSADLSSGKMSSGQKTTLESQPSRPKVNVPKEEPTFNMGQLGEQKSDQSADLASHKEHDHNENQGSRLEKNNLTLDDQEPAVNNDSLSTQSHSLEADFADDFEEENSEPSESVFNQPADDSWPEEQDKSGQEEKPVKEPLQVTDEQLAGAIQNYMVKRFATAKLLFEEVVDFSVSGSYLTFYVTEKGYQIGQVMSVLLKQTEEAFYKQTNKKVIIKLELRPTVKEDKRPSKEQEEMAKRIERMKNFFGDDKIEIIED